MNAESLFPSRPTERLPIVASHELARLKVMEGVEPSSVTPLLGRCMMMQLAPGDAVIRIGEPNATMFLLLSGSLSVHGDDPALPPLGFVHAGETFGEISVLDQRPASATVRAVVLSRVLGMDEDTFWALATASHRFALNLLRMLASRMRTASSRIDDEQRAKRDLEREATTDALTGLPNRRHMDAMLIRTIHRAREINGPLTVVVLDIDRFKSINDTRGHAIGDRVLATVGGVLRHGVRPSDTVSRWGGEEFLLLLPGTRLDGALVVAERIRRALKSTPIPGCPELVVTASSGVSALLPVDTPDTLVARADAALYQAKRGGRDRVECG